MLARAQYDGVSNIHKRWSFTRLTPTSFRASLAGSLAFGAAIIVLYHIFYVQSESAAVAIYIPIGVGGLAALHVADFLALRGTPVNKLSKVAHVSFFANMLWLLTLLLGIAASNVLPKDAPGIDLDYAIAGMLLAAGLRVGIFTSVFGSGIARAIPVAFIQPLVFFFFITPAPAYEALGKSYAGFGFGVGLFLLGVAWAVVTDRAGRPAVTSTFGLLQAFLVAWTEKDTTKLEEFTEARARDDDVETRILRFSPSGSSELNSAAIVLPDVHPGPFGTVGGSNLPYVLYQTYSRKALIMHSVSDHSLNIPSKAEVERYVGGLSHFTIAQRGNTCSVPVQTIGARSTTTGIAFGKSVMLMLSLAPAGMEDIPRTVRNNLESYGKSLGFSDILVVDCHNAMGHHLDDDDLADIISSSRKCLEQLKTEIQHEFKVGFANLEDAAERISTSELGEAGVAVLVLKVGDHSYGIGWADSNNMENSLRDAVIEKSKNGVPLLELCSSDTHSTSGARNRDGYLALGSVTSAVSIAATLEEIALKAASRAKDYCTFELAQATTRIRVMGEKQFEDYSSALDRSMNVTKIFLGVTIAMYIAMLFLS
ncbi:MAG: DUF2070 family protein [Nitrososphaera sp.]